MVSAVVLAKDEEKNIKACLSSVSWCDEIILIDDYSSDNTVKIAEKKGAKVFSRKLNGDFSQQRNFGLQKAKNDWVLFIDADEEVPGALWFEIIQHINSPSENYSAFYIKRQDTMWGKVLRYGETGNAMFIRLAKKEAGKWIGSVHETWEIKGEKLLLKNPINHYPHLNIQKFLREINFYTDLRAKELLHKKTRANWISVIIYPKIKFFQNYILRSGFRDGTAGLIFALMMSFHSFLVRAKLWYLQLKNK